MASIEILRVIHLDAARAVIAIAEYPGEAARVVMPLRAIIGDALRLGTTGLLISHTHPSGDPTPSVADIAVTRRLFRASQALGIRLHDHVVMGKDRSISFRTAGLL